MVLLPSTLHLIDFINCKITVYMRTVYKLAFASSALPSRVIGILIKCLNKCTPNGLYEINSLSNEQHLLCLRIANYQQLFRVRPFCCPAFLSSHTIPVRSQRLHFLIPVNGNVCSNIWLLCTTYLFISVWILHICTQII